ncbi:MAG: short-chain dehydrogenase [Ignavibacteriae bacterium]|nr:short-chain dehydrogenase [Ignavibacteria bacterium]MBI3363385.1 short-chain dehydrogenase [Ignavibacteriota bacterium]
MDIKNRTVVVLGGGGLVGSAICRKLIDEQPKRIIVTSLLRSEAEGTVKILRKEFPRVGKRFFVPWWGNIFVRNDLKDTRREDILSNPDTRAMLIEDILNELTEPVLKRSTIFQLVHAYKPEVIIDCINSATAIAYQDIFQSARAVLKEIQKTKSGGKKKNEAGSLANAAEHLLCTLYTPQLIRHVQILYRSMHASGTKIYVKIGTSGTGGMGLNIPYTHSEERPSSVLLSKSAVAGAHTLLLFLMGRTPDAPITKEIKPAAAIAWKRVAYGEIKKRGKAIELYDCPPSRAIKLSRTLKLSMKDAAKPTGDTLKSVFIDTGENGLFSGGEFEAISTPGQMEFVTPEEIAESVIYEIKGGNTGHDIINALDNASLSPTYRAGYLFQSAKEQIRRLEEEHGVKSIAFEILGPPRLSKLLYEAYLLKVCCGDMVTVMKTNPRILSQKLSKEIRDDGTLRAQIISIGIPILLQDRKSFLRAREIKIPPYHGENEVPITSKNINLWAHDGWVDLRVVNMKRWKNRFQQIQTMVNEIPKNESSSRHLYTSEYWSNFKDIDPGKLAGWIFNYEERGMRMKA